MVIQFKLQKVEADDAKTRLDKIMERRKSGEIDSNQFVSISDARMKPNAHQEANNDDDDEFGSNDMTIFDKLASVEDYLDIILFFSFEFTLWTDSLVHLDFNF